MRKRFSALSIAVVPAALLAVATIVGSCGESTNEPAGKDPQGTDTTDTTDTTQTGNSDLPPGVEKYAPDVEVSRDGDFIVIRSTGVPDHSSPYFDATDSRYAPYNGDNPQFRINPNRIREQNLVFRIPAEPRLDASHPATPMGPIGISLNGVPFYNQYAAGGAPLTGEINSFDQYNGHPQQMGGYHYHIEPLWLTALHGRSALLGFLLDGYPVYGPVENGTFVTSGDLDDFHGHVGPTTEYPEGIYHYHITSDDPYLNGARFYGVPGTISQ